MSTNPHPPLTDNEIDDLLSRFDQTDPLLQRKIVAQFMSDKAWAEIELREVQGQLAASQKRIEKANYERDRAVRQASLRDQKWMDGINEVVGQKLSYDLLDGSLRVGLDDFIRDLRKELAAANKRIAELEGALPPAERLMLLAAWFDADDLRKGRMLINNEVQNDLRAWAGKIMAANGVNR